MRYAFLKDRKNLLLLALAACILYGIIVHGSISENCLFLL